MRILLMCEGQNEAAVINLLLDNNLLIITRDNLIGLKPYAIRQIIHSTIKSELKNYGLPIKIYRIGDKQNDKLAIPNELKRIVNKNEIYKYCTKTGFEMLLIINEGLIKEYEKVKSKMSPKEFAKKNIIFNGKVYDQSIEFIKLYYGGKNVKNLVKNIR